MATIVQHHSTLTDACADLVQTANESGGRDNTTVVLMRIEPDGAPWTNRPSRPPEK